MPKLVIAMMGLPAMGKSSIAYKLEEFFNKEGVKASIFNNGAVRRKIADSTAHHDFYNPENKKGKELREKIANINIQEAKKFLEHGNVAILDATNVDKKRRKHIQKEFSVPVVFVECINGDRALVNQNIAQKAKMREFTDLTYEEAYKSFEKRIDYYRKLYSRLDEERNYIVVDSLNNRIIRSHYKDKLPYFYLLRDLLVSERVNNLFLVRHGETVYNLQNRIGGDPELTEKGIKQAGRLSEHFKDIQVPFIFTGFKQRTVHTAKVVRDNQQSCRIIKMEELNEIDAGVCENMTYEEIMENMPEIFEARSADKYNYVYPEGEGYRTMYDRVKRGLKKALFLAGNSSTLMIIGHQAVNRIILSYFLYRRREDIPYAYIPQDEYFHIVSTPNNKSLQLKKF